METWIIICRPGFENEAVHEVRQRVRGNEPVESRFSKRGGWAAVDTPPLEGGRTPWNGLASSQTVFARQAFLAFAEAAAGSAAELVGLVAKAALDWRKEERLAKGFSSLFVEAADSDAGRMLWPRCDDKILHMS